MKVRIALLFEKITSHFWVIPGVISIFLIALVFYLKTFKMVLDYPFLKSIIFLGADPDAIRQLLSSIATSTMTVLGVMFSIIVVVIEQMSGQYTPRVVSNFTRSKMAQIVLGLYVGTFAYCLILLMNIGQHNTTEDPIPRLAVAVAGLLAILCLFFLIIYIHDITSSIQSTEIIKDIRCESIEALENVIKDREDAHNESAVRTTGFEFCQTLRSSEVGYIDSILWGKIPKKIKITNWEIHFHKSPGDYIQKDMEILSVWSDEPIDDEALRTLEELIDISAHRTIAQDPGYGIQKLSDIALKALSPGINDPSTAIEAINSITTVVLEYLSYYPIRNRIHLDDDKVLIFSPTDPELLIKKSYDKILKFSEQHEDVKDLIRHDLRFIQGKIREKDLRIHVEKKIDSISLLQ